MNVGGGEEERKGFFLLSFEKQQQQQLCREKIGFRGELVLLGEPAGAVDSTRRGILNWFPSSSSYWVPFIV